MILELSKTNVKIEKKLKPRKIKILFKTYENKTV